MYNFDENIYNVMANIFYHKCVNLSGWLLWKIQSVAHRSSGRILVIDMPIEFENKYNRYNDSELYK